jgi:hypothetical protein
MGMQRIQDVLAVVDNNVRVAAFKNILLKEVRQLREGIPGYLAVARGAVERSLPGEDLGGLRNLDGFEAMVTRVVAKAEKIAGR